MNDVPGEIIPINRKVIERLAEAKEVLERLKEDNQYLSGWKLPDRCDTAPIIILYFDDVKGLGNYPATIAGYQVGVKFKNGSKRQPLEAAKRNKLKYDLDHPLFFDRNQSVQKNEPKPPGGAA